MKLSCLQENLNKGLSIVSRLVSTKGTLEILSHILLSTEGGRLKLSATNLEIGVNYKVGAKVEKEGSLTVPARLFSEFISQLSPGKIDMDVANETLSCRAGKIKSQIKGLPADDFPLIPKIKEKKLFSIAAEELKGAINQVGFAAALDETRPVLSGIYFKVEKNKLTLVATDSYRLSEKTVKISSGETKKEAIIPARSLIELSRILDEPGKEVGVYLDDTQVMFETDELEFTSRLVEGKFPDYKNIIPEGSETKAVVDLGEFTRVVKVAALFAREAGGSVSLSTSTKGEIEATSASTQSGESDAVCAAEVTGKDAEIVFNSKYLIDVVSGLSGGKISLELSGKLNPGVIKKDGDESFVYVIMPLRA